MYDTVTPAPLVAIVYDDGQRIAPLMDQVVTCLRLGGWRLAGLRQIAVSRPGRSRCDMILEDLASGATAAISQDRGAGARGCRLDVNALQEATARAGDALDARPDLLIVNKFGKSECEGGGCRPLITDAVERGVPVVVAVPCANLGAWRAFAGDLATAELDLESLQDREDDSSGRVLADPERLVETIEAALGNHRNISTNSDAIPIEAAAR